MAVLCAYIISSRRDIYPSDMLIKNAILQRIVSGEIDLAYRRWKRPTVKAGGTLRTAVGELAIDDVTTVIVDAITEAEARRAGYNDLEELKAELSKRPDRDVFRVALRYQGDDQRTRLRNDDTLSDPEYAEIVNRIGRLGKASHIQDLSLTVLKWIEEWPESRAQDLSDEIGVEKPRLKNHIRKLKELGLTESKQTGYRLSARGQRVLRFAETNGKA